MLESILPATGMTLAVFLYCAGASLALGVLAALVYMFRNTYTKQFAVTLALLPVMVQVVITLVNGNLGAGVAVMGAFSLIRFRSVPGSAREIASVFLAMAIGLATGMGYLAIAALLLALVAAASFLLQCTPFGEQGGRRRQLKVVIPEDLDYAGVFDDIFAQYTRAARLTRVKTTNLGSLYELVYEIELRDISREKELIDAIRCRNGNLNITCGLAPAVKEGL